MPKGKLFGLVYNPRVPAAWKLTQGIVDILSLEDDSCWIASALDVDGFHSHMADTSLVITVGGDGTILRTIRVAAPHHVPILGVNLGRLGFMTEMEAEEALEKIPQYVNGDAWVEERTMLQAMVIPGDQKERIEESNKPQPFHALNEAVVGRGAAARLIEVEARIDGALVATYRADGVITSTATGSTGYALSVGGPILNPQSEELLLVPVAAHMSLNSALVLPQDSLIELTVLTDHEAILSVDGFVDVSLSSRDRIQIKTSPYRARFMRSHPATHFYATLTQRLELDRGKSQVR